ncbi:MAG: SCO family protein [Pirellulales bacterium]|nr:SCO family protein [Pirellulales bacterium]
MKWRLLVWGFVFLAICGMYGFSKYRRAQQHQAALDKLPPLTLNDAVNGRQVEPFELTRESGETFNTDSLDGKIWVASFFFTSCPGFCLKQNRSIADLTETLGDKDVTFVSVSVDPKVDTPPELVKYASHFQADPARWVFLTGDMDTIRNVAKDTFLVTADRETHSGRLFLVGRDGKIVASYNGTDPVDMKMLSREIDKLTSEST